jgi:ABC-type bacteriocin/lantibiotic exporter with double-glycine peptidase domain
VHNGAVSLISCINEIFIINILLGLLIWLSWKIFLGLIFFSLIIILIYKKYIGSYAQLLGLARKTGEKNKISLLQNMFGFYKEIKIYGLYTNFIEQYQRLFDATSKSVLHHLYLQQSPKIFFELFGILFLIIIALFFDDHVKVLTIFILIFRIASSSHKILAYLQSINFVYPIFKKLDKNSSFNKAVIELNKFQSIELININFAFHEKTIFSNFNLKFNNGEKIAITGASGVGKSTLINLLMMIERCSSGTFLINGNQIDHDTYSYICDYITYVSQKPFFINDSIINNLYFLSDRSVDYKFIEYAAEKLGVLHAIKAQKNGWNTSIGELKGSFSGGQLQRLSILRGLCRNTEMLILDEVTSNLDNESEDVVIDFILDLYKDKTVILVTHSENAVKKFDRIVNLNAI